MYIAVRKYHIIPGSSEEFLQRVQEGFLPLISQAVGFIAYEAWQVGNGHVVTISTFDTRAGTEESILQALRWVQEHVVEFMQGVPELTVQALSGSPRFLPAIKILNGKLVLRYAPFEGMPGTVSSSHQDKLALLEKSQLEKTLVTDLTFEAINPGELGHQAYADPRIRGMVTAIGRFLTEMRTDPVRRDKVIYRFERDILPEEEAKGLYEADHVILIKRGTRLAGYIEINRETDAWLRRDRYEGDIIVDPAVYRRNEEGTIVEKGIGEQGLLEMRRQGRLLGVKDIELDVYLRNQPMHHFLGHLMATHKLPFTKSEMTSGGLLDFTYVLSCKDASGRDLSEGCSSVPKGGGASSSSTPSQSYHSCREK